MKDYSEIQCPELNCNGTILLEPARLLQGSSFSCSNPNCKSLVTLNPISYPVTNHAMNEFEKVKQGYA